MIAYTLEPAETLTPAALAALRRIYEDGFPPHQRAGFEDVTGQRQDGEFALALISDGQPYGFAMLRPLGGTGWIFLRYFVVDHGRRGQGLGGVLWELLTARLREAGFTLLVFDVDDPDDPACGPDQSEVRFRRIRFYQRNGASLLPVIGYRAPHGAHETSAWSPMLLMTARLSGGTGPLGNGQARAVVAAVYRFRWELDPGDLPVTVLAAGGHDPRRHHGVQEERT
jgi:GNAT superfamily N-acetyltransferase